MTVLTLVIVDGMYLGLNRITEICTFITAKIVLVAELNMVTLRNLHWESNYDPMADLCFYVENESILENKYKFELWQNMKTNLGVMH